MASDSAILNFLEHVKVSNLKDNETKAKDMIATVRKEVERLGKLKNIPKEGKDAIRELKKMIKDIESNKFVSAQGNYSKVKKGFKNHIQKTLKESKEGSKEVEKLPDAVGKSIPWQQKQRSAKGPKTSGAASADNARNDHRNKPPPITRKVSDAHRTRSTKSRNGGAKEGGPAERNTTSETQNRISGSTAYRVQDKVEMERDESIPNKDDKKQNMERNQKVSKEKNVYSDIIQANDPQRVKDMFASLHDNEWMDALGVLQNKSNATGEAGIVRQLIQIVQIAYDFCQHEADSQLEQIEKEIRCIVVFGKPHTNQKSPKGIPDKDITNNPTDADLVKQYRLLHYEHALDNLHSKFKIKMGKGLKIDPRVLQNGDFAKYLEKCIDVTWLMCLQDPPTMLHPTDRFVPSLYTTPPKNYDVDFITWPALMFRDGVLALGEVRYKRVS